MIASLGAVLTPSGAARAIAPGPVTHERSPNHESRESGEDAEDAIGDKEFIDRHPPSLAARRRSALNGCRCDWSAVHQNLPSVLEVWKCGR